MKTKNKIWGRLLLPLFATGLILCLSTQTRAERIDSNHNNAPDQNDINVNSPEQTKTKSKSTNLLDQLIGPIIKATPMDWEKVPTNALPEMLRFWKNFKKQMEELYGTNISIVLLDHHQHILNGPGSRKGRNIFWWNMTVKQKLWESGKLIFKVRGGSGTTEGNPPNGITPLVGSRLNIDWAAYETELLYVANVYLEQKFLNDKLLIAFGKMSFPDYFDENKVAGDWDFFSHSLNRNQILPHRYHTIGILARYNLSEDLYVQAGTTDAQGIRSETGINTAFHGEDYFMTMAELGIRTKNSEGLESNYRFDLCYDPQPLTRYDGKGSERDTVEFGISFDKMLTEKVGAFCRYGLADGRVRKFSHYWSLGGIWKGPDPARDKDELGFGMGQGITHQDFRDANNATNTETIFETYYKIFIKEWCSLTLDLQTLLNPGTNSSNDNSVIAGFRLKILL